MSWKKNLLRPSITNRILPVEIWGHTLVVVPKGDASGFSETEFAHEKLLLEKLVQDPQLQHIVVDLKNSQYFGNDVTAVILDLVEQCRAAGKSCGLCNVSDAMQIPLRDLQNNPACRWYGSRRQAEQDLVRLTASERVQRLFRRRDFRLFLMLVFVCLIGWWITTLRTRQSELLDHCDRLEKILRQHRSMRDLGNLDDDWEQTLASFRLEIESILKDIENDKSEAANEIRAACVENLLPLLGSPWQGVAEQVRWDRAADEHLKTARRMLDAVPEDEVEK
ncbi:MAG: STAS domain-containing protein [Planctomycetaceae bacterium]